MSSSNQYIILESLMENYNETTTKQLLEFFLQEDLIQVINDILVPVEDFKETRNFIIKEVEDRIDLYQGIPEAIQKIKRRQKLENINFSIENAREIIAEYGKKNISSPCSKQKIPKFAKPLKNIKTILNETEYSSSEDELQYGEAAESVPTINKTEILASIRNSCEIYSSERTFTTPKIRQNVAQILRENFRIKQKREKMEKIYKELTNGSVDPFLTQKLLEEAHKREKQDDLAKMEQKHLFGLQTREKAKLAKYAYQRANRLKALETKKQNQQLERKLAIWRKEEESRIRESVEKGQTKLQQQQIRIVQANLIDAKRENVRKIQIQSLGLNRKAEQQKRDELSQKIDLIRQIKNLEVMSKGSRKKLPLTIESKCNMTIDELRTKLIELRTLLQNQTDEKRNKIIAQRTRLQKLIQDAAQNINNHKKCTNIRKIREFEKNKQMLGLIAPKINTDFSAQSKSCNSLLN